MTKIIAKTIAGFMNSYGGVLLIGVADDCMVFGIEKDLQTIKSKGNDEYQRFLMQVIEDYLSIEFSKYVDINFEEQDNKTVCIVKVERSPKPVFLLHHDEKEFYIRVGNSTKPLDIESAHEYIGMHWEV